MHYSRILLFAAAVLLLSGPVTTFAHRPDPATEKDSRTVAATYNSSLNAALQSGDFAPVAGLYAEDATLTQSNTARVTHGYTGRAAILAFYQGLPAKFPGIQFAREGVRTLAAQVILAYDYATAPQWTVPARCVHAFTVRAGEIQRHDWIVYFGGKP